MSKDDENTAKIAVFHCDMYLECFAFLLAIIALDKPGEAVRFMETQRGIERK